MLSVTMKKSAEYYKKNPESYAKKLAYDKQHNAKPEQRAKRAELVKVNRDRKTYGNGDGKDASHTSKGIVMKKASVNRASKTDTAGDRRARGGKK
jgi:hypothetical protein